jgi:hypothetical protein
MKSTVPAVHARACVHGLEGEAGSRNVTIFGDELTRRLPPAIMDGYSTAHQRAQHRTWYLEDLRKLRGHRRDEKRWEAKSRRGSLPRMCLPNMVSVTSLCTSQSALV